MHSIIYIAFIVIFYTAWGKINSIRLSPDYENFIVAMEDSCRILYLDPLDEQFHIFGDQCGSLAYAEMFYDENYIFVVPTKDSTKFPPNSVYVYDSELMGFVWEILFPTPVLAIRGRKSSGRSKVIFVTE